MEKATKNIVKILKRDKSLRNVSITEMEVFVKAVCDVFTLIPKSDMSRKNFAFHNLRYGVYGNSLTEEELDIYIKLWDATWISWQEHTDETIGPFEFIEIDHSIINMIERKRLFNETKEKQLTLEIGSPGWIVAQNLEKSLAAIRQFWPRKKAKQKVKKVVENTKQIEDKTSEKITVYIYENIYMDEKEYSEWYAKVENKADVMYRVVTKEMTKSELDSLRGKT